VVFEDISFFEDMDEVWLKGLIADTKREKANIKRAKSVMMLNPLKIKHLNNIDNLKADIVVLNLEDGVAKDMKKKALLLSSVFLSNLKKSSSKIIVRVNPFDEGGKEEIKFLNNIKPDSIRVAKIREREDVERVLEILNSDIKLHLSIETKEALENLRHLNVDDKVECCSLGIMDMLNSLGLSQNILDYDNPTIHYIMSRFLVDARIAGMYPIGFTYQKYKDIDGFKRWCELEKRMGYSAKSCLGPAQVDVANEIFSSDNEAIKRAKYIKKRFEDMGKESISGFMDDKYGFIDEPIYKDAILTLENLG
jgi:citrate lyase subunit beta/citryl-CoA lyase